MKVKRWFLAATLLLGVGIHRAGNIVVADDGTVPPTGFGGRPLVHLDGVVTQRPEGTPIGRWVIGEQAVEVVESTKINEEQGKAEVGALVTVLAKWRDSADAASATLEAVSIRVLSPAAALKPVIIRGRVSELGTNHLIVNETRIHFDRSTRIIGRLEVGAFVVVRAIRTPIGLHALSITVPPDPTPRVIEFEGVIERIGSPTWQIAGRTVTVDRRTTIIGRPEVGLKAKVKALVQSDGELLALVIRVHNIEPVVVRWIGRIELLPPEGNLGRWVVGGRAVWVTDQTAITGTPRVGLPASVEALQYEHRPLTARKIDILSVGPAETPTPSP